MFRTEDIATQMGTFSLVPQVVDAVKVPVIAAGGIGDARGIAAAFMLGASAVQIGTAYLFCPESTIADPHRKALLAAKEHETALTNVFTGRPARGIVNRIMREVGPMSPLAPAFPLAGGAVAPLRAATEPTGSGDFMSLWSGQSAALGRPVPAATTHQGAGRRGTRAPSALAGSAQYGGGGFPGVDSALDSTGPRGLRQGPAKSTPGRRQAFVITAELGGSGGFRPGWLPKKSRRRP